MSDNTLTTLMGRVPSRLAGRCHRQSAHLTRYFRSIVLLEDLDAAFTRSVSRDGSSTGVPTVPPHPRVMQPRPKQLTDTLSLSGLLNSLDGVAAAEGPYVARCCRRAILILAFRLPPRTTSSASTLR
jgi:chaperone BCS1